MSKSRRKPFIVDSSTKKFGKRYANKKVRRYKGVIQNGKWYRKIYNSWDICDYKWYVSPNDKFWDYNYFIRK